MAVTVVGLVELEVGKRRFRSLFWRVRAEIRRQVCKGGRSRNLSFHYDPFSYALNFDDGGGSGAGGVFFCRWKQGNRVVFQGTI